MLCAEPSCTAEATKAGRCGKHYMAHYRRQHQGQPPPELPGLTEPTATDLAAALQSTIAAALASAQPAALMDLTEQIAELKTRLEALETRPARRLEVTCNGKTHTVDGLTHSALPRIIRYVAAGLNVMLVGPAGSGKTTLARQVAEALDLPFRFSGAILTKYELLGYMDASGRYVRTAFRDAYEHGGIFLWDEIDASSPEALVAFNAGLENGHMDFPDGPVTRHQTFRAIGAANTYGRGADRQYVGRNQLDAATLDRFAVLDLDYDETLETQLAGNPEWTAKVQAWRRAAATLKIRHVISPRASIRGAVMLAAGEAETDVEASLVWRGLDTAQVNKIKGN